MFIIVPAGCGKTTVWKTLLQTHKSNGEDAEFDTLNPKAVNFSDAIPKLNNGETVCFPLS